MVFLKPAEILAAAIAVAKKKEEISWWKTFVAGFMGGLFTSMGILFAVRVGGGVPNAAPGAQRLYFGALAPTGMFMIVLTNAELVRRCGQVEDYSFGAVVGQPHVRDLFHLG